MTDSAYAVIFDLDGTLVDPAGGITGGIEYALRVMDVPVPSADRLRLMVGPKLADGLLAHTPATADQLPQLIGIYRDWYREHGISMGTVYPGIHELLAELGSSGVGLAVATQKPQTLASVVLASKGLDTYFDAVYGSHDDETVLPGHPDYRDGKAGIVAAAMNAVAPSAAVMVGDRSHDVTGARANGIDCVGVGWGFGEDGELAAAGAIDVVDDALELSRVLAALRKEAAVGAV